MTEPWENAISLFIVHGSVKTRPLHLFCVFLFIEVFYRLGGGYGAVGCGGDKLAHFL